MRVQFPVLSGLIEMSSFAQTDKASSRRVSGILEFIRRETGV